MPEVLRERDGNRTTSRVQGRIGFISPEVRSTVAVTVTDGLAHEDTDVQEAVLSFLERHGGCDDSQLAEAVFRHRGHVAASLRGRLDGLIGVTVPLIETRPGRRSGREVCLGSGARHEDFGHTMHFYPFHLETEPDVPKGTDRNLVTVQFHRVTHDWQGLGGPTVDTVRWVATVWPIARESFFAAGARAIVANIDWQMPNWENRAYLEPLLDPDTPLKPMALLLLALGLATKEPSEHGLAADALAAAVEDGRVDDVELGEVMAQLLPTGLIKLARWAKTLGEVAGVSPLHAYVVRSAIERSLRGNPGKAPHGLYALLDVLKELVFEAGDRIRSEAARAFLRQVKGTGKTAKAAKTLLACEASASADNFAQIMPAVVQRRLERAARWTRRKGSCSEP